jgi:hypothetical protein
MKFVLCAYETVCLSETVHQNWSANENHDCKTPSEPGDVHTSNEKEISHGKVSWQTRWTHFAMGPLASSIG